MTEPQKVPEAPRTGPDDGTEKTKADMRHDARPAWWALLSLTGIATLLLLVFGLAVKSWPVALVEMLLGATSLSVGAFFGFLFGMPRPAADGAGDSTYRPSTNLEQVSDWLTKILIGAGLVQLASLRDGLAGVGTLVSKTVTPVPVGTDIVTQLVLVVFLVVGFLSSFLWTRLYYGRIQTLTDRSLSQEVERVERTQKKLLNIVAQQALPAGAPASSTGSAGGNLHLTAKAKATTQLPPEIQAKIDQFKKAPHVWNSDPNARIFRGAPREANGRRLEAEIVADFDDGLMLKLRVVRVGGDPLTAETLFLLHPTFPDRILTVVPQNDVAETGLYAEGAFTTVAIADNGQTVLAYDLAELPNAPNSFRTT